ncbi:MULTISPECIES: beta-ketoacyl-ACP synthase III [unclassified Streptomyces]|uniref:beta-ketoacyl-ACP synthase III n=1 Tax=unclassified Streptomyces TaxID=2593676 RepID=UPI0036604059
MRRPEPHRPSSAVVCGIGAALPPRTVSNTDLAAELGTDDAWIRTRTGITHRHIAGTDATTEDLATRAAAHALESAGTRQAGALILATATPDHQLPATAPAVAARLGLTAIPAFDIAAACTGFLYALATAAGFIAGGTADMVLVIGADRISHLLDPGDRTTRPIFGDGAGAVLLRRGSPGEPGALGPLMLGSDGTHHDLLKAPHGGHLRMDGPALFRHAVDRMRSASQDAAHAAGWRTDDIDRLVPHQANARITNAVADRLGIPPEGRLQNIQHVGNTSAASIPLLLAQACADRRITAGHRLLLTAFGAGLTWGATTLTWPDLTTSQPPTSPAPENP